MVSTSTRAEPPVVQPSPTPNRPPSVSTNTSTMRFVLQRVRGFHSLPPISRSISRGVTLVIFMVAASVWRGAGALAMVAIEAGKRATGNPQAAPRRQSRRMAFLGITVMPEYIQTEGVEPLLDNLARAGVTAVATSPYVMAPADEATGVREPPGDAEAGKVRLLDRPLWGRRALFVRTAPSFVPDRSLYRGLRYQPSAPDGLGTAEGGIVADFIAAAKARGLEVHLQVQAAIPPGYRVQFGGPLDDDLACLPDGSPLGARVDKNGSLASPHIQAYGCALIRDLVRAYPAIDALRVDWPEYPPYSFASLFTDFSGHAEAAAGELGFDFAAMRADVLALFRELGGKLEDGDLEAALAPDAGYWLLRRLARRPAILAWLRFKAALSLRLLAAYHAVLNDAGGGRIAFVPHAFPPPWSLLSGFDYAAASAHCDGIGVKLYTMHWPMMLRGYGEALLAKNPRLSEALLARCLARLCDVRDDGPAQIGDFAYPEPDEAHPVGAGAQARKITRARAEARVPVYAFAHGYGPTEDVAARMAVAWRASDRRMWVNRYGYLRDAKLDALGALPR
ncbi:MAG TPA: hypothetical protein VFV80_01435 [Geminicoccaceae bacterium]|nr:hypothetical protein [Geminicoccaceae bacterium]